MKKTILTIVIGLTLILSSIAQESTDRSSTAGLKGGYNLAAVSYDDDSETGQRHGFHIGFYGESFLSKAVALQLEVNYSQQGYELKDGGGTFTQKLNYINLPVMLKIYLDTNFFLEVGPQVGLAISHKEEFDSNFNLFDTSQEFDPQNFDWGVNFGGGFKTDTGVTIGVRYHSGMGDIYDEGNPKNRVWQFSIGFDL
ncbi:MAG: PorT family protein [Bacteroidia bacterium]|nr:PorT family protein [Bacteroidia bacterium]NND26851.1 PorT family protein [Flavobacteriaceae bacterium]MBT8277996.1 PorT family protein [Bacteroidia bacterium]NNK61251.1 PorT family protein [Flavobacteriaceae bacterium]NNL32678.1 PorT family protein [Flavobacteriaceae bacterium]